MRNRANRLLAVGLAASLLFGTAACGSDDDDNTSTTEEGAATTEGGEAGSPAITSIEDLAGKTIGVQTGTTGETYANENKPEGATVKSFEDTTGLFGALESGDIDAILQDLPVNAGRVAEDDSVAVVETYETGEEYGFAVAKGNELRDELNTALQAVRDDGTYDLLYAKYFPLDGEDPGPGPEPSDVTGTDTLTVCSDIPYAPMEMEGEGPRGLQYTGFDIELIDALAVNMDAKVEVLDVVFDGILGNLSAGTCDVVASSLTITEERQAEVDFTDPYFAADQSLLVKVG
jgi:polar amino acid transport system substrate-binding protein